MKHYSPKYKRFYDDSYYYKDHEYKPSKRSKYVIRRNDPLVYINRRMNMAKNMEREMYFNNICPSGWTKGQGFAALYRAWEAFIIRKSEDDKDGMETYAKVIRKIQQDINLQIRDFPDLKLAALEYMNEDENKDLLEEKAEELEKDVDDLSTEDVLSVMMQQDRLAYELAGMQY